MKHRLKAISCFVASWAVLGLAFTPAYRMADLIVLSALAIYFALLVAMKITLIWKHRHDPHALNAQISSGQAGVFPQKWRRWILDE